MSKRLVFYKPLVRKWPTSRTYYLGFVNLAAYVRQHLSDWDIHVERDASKILARQPDAVGISCVTEMWPRIVALVHKLRLAGFTGSIFIGGPHIGALPETLPKEATCACLAWGEETLVELLAGVELSQVKGIAYWQDGALIRTPPREPPDVDSLPVDIHFMPELQMHIKTVWGCPDLCRHCVEAVLCKKPMWLSAERLVEIMCARIAATGNYRFFFHNSSFIVPPGRLERLHALMQKKGLLGKVTIDIISLTASQVTEQTMPLLREIGTLRLGMGTESLNPRMLKIIKRGTVTLTHMEQTMRWAKEVGFSSIGGAPVFGYPGETVEDMRDCLRRIEDYTKQGLYRAWGCYVCQPIPGSLLWKRLFRQGDVSLDMDFSRLRTDADETYFKSQWFYSNNVVVPRKEFVRLLRQPKRLRFKGSS